MKRATIWGKITATVVIIAAILSLFTVPALGAEEAPDENSENSVVLSETGSQTTIRIAHTNDIHGYYTSTSGGVLGFAMLKAIVNAQDTDLLLDAGDTYHGQAFATVEKGMSIAELMKSAGYDATTPGNHDWSYGAERLKELETAQGFPILASNVVTDSGNQYFDTPYIIKDVEADDGTILRVGVLGVIDDSFYSSTASDNVAGLKFQEEAASATAVAKQLKEEESCDIIIALTHQADCEAFVSSISGVDAVIAGHDHILMDKSYNDAQGKPVAVVEAGNYFYNVGVLAITYDAESDTVTDTSETVYSLENTGDITPDEAIASQISAIETREQATLSTIISSSEKAYPYSWEEVRTSEQEIGRIITAAYLERTGADVAFENAGGIRSGIPMGDITYKDLISISPYGNTLLTKQMTGKQILELVEYSLELNRSCDEIYTLQKQATEKGEDPYQYSWPSNSGSALQFGGITVTYDMSKDQGSRVVSASIKGEKVDPDRLYTVATNSYAAESADYPYVADCELVKEYGTCEEALRAYFVSGDFEKAAETPNVSAIKVEEDKPNDEKDPVKPGDTTTPVKPEESKPVTKPTDTTNPQKPATEASPQTGDAGIAWLVAVSGFSLCCLLVLMKIEQNKTKLLKQQNHLHSDK